MSYARICFGMYTVVRMTESNARYFKLHDTLGIHLGGKIDSLVFIIVTGCYVVEPTTIPVYG